MSLFLYRTKQGTVVEKEDKIYIIPGLDWDSVFGQDDPLQFLLELLGDKAPGTESSIEELGLLPPIGSQEVWAAGVTYYQSREARIKEAQDTGGGDFYARVYDADRPELFFKSTPHRTVGHQQQVRIRKDSTWNVPEPEVTLAISSGGRIFGYTIGNDMSSRDIEGQNPLYLTQAKVYDQSCAIGPGIHVTADPLHPATEINIEIRRADQPVFTGTTQCAQIKRPFETLAAFLFRDNTFPHGCFLMTGTGIVPPDDFTLQHGDEIRITVDTIGTLTNIVMEG